MKMRKALFSTLTSLSLPMAVVGSMLSLSAPALAQESQTNLKTDSQQDIQIAGAVDILMPISLVPEQTTINRPGIRAVEFTLFGPIDQTFDGVLNFAGHSPLGFPHEEEGAGAHEEEGFIFEVHEAYVGSTKIIPRSRFKVGKFLLGVGRLNQYHQHDWPMTSAPIVQREFFTRESTAIDAEGASDTGLEFSTLLPLPFYLDVTLGVTNGYCWGHCHGEELRPATPIHYVRPATFFSFGESGSGLLLALNYLGHKEGNGLSRTLFGLDATYKLREGRRLKWLVQSEIWNQNIDASLDPEIANGTRLGAYVYPQYGIDESLSVGMRFDGLQDDEDLNWGVAPNVTYKTSEFSTMRASYTHEFKKGHAGEADFTDQRFELQFIYLLGAHPAHDF